MRRSIQRTLWYLSILALIVTSCSSIPSVAPSPALSSPIALPTAASSAVTIPSPVPSIPATPTLASIPSPARVVSSLTPTPLSLPTRNATVPVAQPITGTMYINPDQLWSMRYPSNQFRVEILPSGMILFRSVDTSMWLAVHSYMAKGNEYGNTGEGLRNQARDMLTQILGQPPSNSIPLAKTEYPWDTGITYSASGGITGEAIYSQPGRTDGNFQVYGILFGYPTSKPSALSALQTFRNAFLPIAVKPLAVASGSQPLWLMSSVGMRNYYSNLDEGHFVAIFSRAPAWREISHLDLKDADYLGGDTVQQVQVAPPYLWLQAESGIGAHSGCFELASFDGQRLKSEIADCNSSPGVGTLRDLNSDKINDVILNASDAYVFCYACGVRFVQYTVLRWDGTRMVEVKLAPLPATTNAQVRQLTNRAVELAQAELWQDARTPIEQALALAPQDPTVQWDAALIRLYAEGRAAQARTNAYPLLDHLFNGDYPSALAILRPYKPAALFSVRSPLVVGTSAEDFKSSLTDWITNTTTLALQAKPDLADAYFLRGWGIYQTSPGSPKALADIERASQMNPTDSFFAASAAYLRTVTLPPLANRERIQFAPAAISTSLNLNLSPGVPRGLVLRVLAQQKMSITVPVTVDVAVLDAQDNGLPFGMGRGSSLEITIPATGDYTVVFSGQGNATVTISIPPK
jgi:tetratricopeptide (TPR) repeat protein